MKGFEVADEYAGKFELFKEFFALNETLDVEKLQEEDHGQENTTIHFNSLVA